MIVPVPQICSSRQHIIVEFYAKFDFLFTSAPSLFFVEVYTTASFVLCFFYLLYFDILVLVNHVYGSVSALCI